MVKMCTKCALINTPDSPLSSEYKDFSLILSLVTALTRVWIQKEEEDARSERKKIE